MGVEASQSPWIARRKLQIKTRKPPRTQFLVTVSVSIYCFISEAPNIIILTWHEVAGQSPPVKLRRRKPHEADDGTFETFLCEACPVAQRHPYTRLNGLNRHRNFEHGIEKITIAGKY